MLACAFAARSLLSSYHLPRAKMATYQLRFFSDGDAGVCLWGGNSATVERFGYTLGYTHELADLPLPAEVVDAGESITRRWTAFAGMNHWPDGDNRKKYRRGAQHFFGLLLQHLPDDFEVLDESDTA